MTRIKEITSTPKLMEDDLIGDARPIQEIKKGLEMPLAGLVRYFNRNATEMASDAFWNVMLWILDEGIPAIKDHEWGRVKYGTQPWEEMEIKDRADLFQRFIDPVLAKGREVIQTYDQATQEVFSECTRKAVEIKADKTVKDPVTGEQRIISKFTPDRKRQPSPETLEKAKRAKELKEQGLTMPQIAEELGVARTTAYGYIAKPVEDTYYNIISVSDKDAPPRPKSQGTSKEYRQALLDRDAPELAEKVRVGELSAHAAAKKLGKVRSHTLNIGPKADPVKLAQKLVEIDRELAISIALEIQNLCTEE